MFVVRGCVCVRDSTEGCCLQELGCVRRLKATNGSGLPFHSRSGVFGGLGWLDPGSWDNGRDPCVFHDSPRSLRVHVKVS